MDTALLPVALTLPAPSSKGATLLQDAFLRGPLHHPHAGKLTTRKPSLHSPSHGRLPPDGPRSSRPPYMTGRRFHGGLIHRLPPTHYHHYRAVSIKSCDLSSVLHIRPSMSFQYLRQRISCAFIISDLFPPSCFLLQCFRQFFLSCPILIRVLLPSAPFFSASVNGFSSTLCASVLSSVPNSALNVQHSHFPTLNPLLSYVPHSW